VGLGVRWVVCTVICTVYSDDGHKVRPKHVEF